jgi:hypothetical protein
MNGFSRIAACAVLALGTVARADEPRIFIPWSPLDESELAKERDRMKRTPGLSDAFIEKELENVSRFHAYRDADILRAYPAVSGHRRLSACKNTMMSNATEFVYLASKGQNEVALETIRCRGAENGLMCWPLQREKRYFLDGSDRYFLLEGVTLATAKQLLATYQAGRISNVPEWMKQMPTKISLIKALPAVGQYQMIFGDFLCSGCVTKMDVKVETVNGEDRLVIQGQADTTCV